MNPALPAPAPVRWDAPTSDRAAGVLMGLACGDALGAPFEFGPPLAADTPVAMVGGGSFGWAPGEWTDDTQMAVVLLEAAERAVAGEGALTDHLDDVAAGWAAWAEQATDVGVQTRGVLSAASRHGAPTAAGLTAAAVARHEATGRSGGNGSLMRTAPAALAYLHDEAGMAEAARTISALTHTDPEAGDACVLWCAAIRHAILTGQLDARHGLHLLPEDRRGAWAARLDEAEENEPAAFDHNGWVVHALQGAWSAISRTAVPDRTGHLLPADHFRLALEAAVRGGRDTDTVAAIAGSLLGARWGASAVPAGWRRVVHGWPGLRVTELGLRGLAVARRHSDVSAWPLSDRVDYRAVASGRLIRHPHDAEVFLGDAAVLDALPVEVDAVVSLCRVGRRRPDRVDAADHVEVWLVDSPDPVANPHLDYVLREAADVVAELRASGRCVLVHCAAAQSRTPTVGAAYAVRHLGIDADRALKDVVDALPDARPHRTFRDAVRQVTR
ncbi:ADP-ribosylglycohydrolase family protein [Cellulomonas bogoriensis]|uniref:Ribosylglycohydrolase n=1 Tax=Cellulomonas bogoriensis 69B4 = DSM 16987 TaxID=1386082 RepID=A0A0A0C2L5_9CELL|nr:ADP-ribosylglycohydrolase family protein [Cellulomonas bogoriensis]KGM14426.1 ribosylglycohydrolase [Cellulomonas bogoriensis 69B4 = DSM 16987]